MIICNRCAGKNEDEALVCVRCGHKLQSRRGEAEPGQGFGSRPHDPLEPLRAESGEGLRLFARAFEIVGLCVLLLVAAGYWIHSGVWWPVLLGAVLGVGLLLLRRER